jgi:two-component system response regulator AlgR
MIRVLIVDDEAPARARLHRLLERTQQVEVCGEASSGIEALELVDKTRPQLLLLDIRMPEMDGMTLAKKLEEQPNPPLVIFTTAYSDHALEAFGVEAVDYLLKPIRFEHLQQSLQRVQKRIELHSNVLEKSPQFLRTTLQGKAELIAINDVLLLQAEQKYVVAYTHDRELIIDASLKQIESRYHNIFVRIHRNALVPVEQLIGVEKDHEGRLFALINGLDKKPEISRRHQVEARKVIKDKSARA